MNTLDDYFNEMKEAARSPSNILSPYTIFPNYLDLFTVKFFDPLLTLSNLYE